VIARRTSYSGTAHCLNPSANGTTSSRTMAVGHTVPTGGARSRRALSAESRIITSHSLISGTSDRHGIATIDPTSAVAVSAIRVARTRSPIWPTQQLVDVQLVAVEAVTAAKARATRSPAAWDGDIV
jgi:hypothetical protein